MNTADEFPWRGQEYTCRLAALEAENVKLKKVTESARRLCDYMMAQAISAKTQRDGTVILPEKEQRRMSLLWSLSDALRSYDATS